MPSQQGEDQGSPIEACNANGTPKNTNPKCLDPLPSPTVSQEFRVHKCANLPARVWRMLVLSTAFAAFGLGGLCLSLFVIPLLCWQPFTAHNAERRRAISQSCIHRCFRFFAKAWCLTGLIDFKFENAEALRSDAGCILVANHPTLIDYVFLVSQLPRCDCIVKGSLWNNVFLRGIVRNAGYIPNRDASRLLAICHERLAAGATLLIFPEGTRTRPGQPPTLQRGAANIAVRCNVPVRVIRILCDPPFLTKGATFWDTTRFIPRFRINVGEKIFPPHGNAESASGRTARQLTELLSQKLSEHAQ